MRHELIDRSEAEPGASRGGACPCCGAVAVEDSEPVLKRGAVVVAFDPLMVTWRGKFVPLSPTEAHVYAHLARRGRCTYEEIDEVLVEFGAKPATRALVLAHIRTKFRKLGACEPFERLGNVGLRVQVDADDGGARGLVIGLRLPRHLEAAAA